MGELFERLVILEGSVCIDVRTEVISKCDRIIVENFSGGVKTTRTTVLELNL